MNNKPAMDREQWLAVSPYLDQALDLPPEELEPWLQQLEVKAPHIAKEVRRLLAVQEADPFATFLSGSLGTPPPADVQSVREGELLGSYRVLRELGRGGMAVVYLAERADGHFEQQVALKVLRFGAQGGEARSHFAQERQILASLSHPAIARLIDGGITPSGVPYLAMEYVEGMRIDRYCDEHRLSIEDRLRLFLKVAEAVQYAHRRLIVHRDLKPSNIVVTAEGAVKLLDFGIAKLLDPQAMEHAAPPTVDVIKLMTPEYASPEQVKGEAITTATDIYQLGLLLYELLTGQPPYDVRGSGALEALRVICESEPLPPSVAVSRAQDTDESSLSTISAARATTPERLRRLLRGDLQAILLMALRKEPERRYGSVGRLMEDVVSHLEGLPVSAYKGVWGYRAGKFVRRHAGAVAISTLAVCAFAFTVVWYTMQLANERDRAEREAATASQVSEFLARVFRGSSTRIAQADTPARELLERGAERIDTELANQPQVQGRLLNVIGDVYVQYDLNDKAQPLLERALRQNTQVFGERSPEVAASKQALAGLARNLGEYDKAQQLYQEALDIYEHTLGPRHVAAADVSGELAFTLYQKGAYTESARAAERAIAIYTDSASQDNERALRVANMLALALSNTGELTRARAQYEQLVPRVERQLGPDHRHLAATLVNLANVKRELQDYDGVEQHLQRAIGILERLYGPNHGSIAICQFNLGLLLYETGRFQEAIKVIERTIHTQQQVSGPGHEMEASAHRQWGRVLHARGDFKAALAQQQIALEMFRTSVGVSHWSYARTLQEYSEIQIEMGQLREAAAAMQEAVPIMRRSLPAESYDLATALVVQSVLLTRTGKPVEAEAQVREAISRYQKVLPSGHRLLAAASGALGESLLAQGKVSEAEGLLLQSAKQLENVFVPARRLSLQRLIQLYERKQDQASAQRIRDELAAFERQVQAQ